MKFILAKKVEMSQVFDENGRVHPVTWLLAGPIFVTQKKSAEKDGYVAGQVGFGSKKEKNVKKPQKKLGTFEGCREFRGEDQMSGGDKIDVSVFKEGDIVNVSGTSKGKGFQGVVKRHGFAGGPRTHGQKHSEREPGSIGGGLRTHVPKGMRMAGRMGSDRITQKNLKVVFVDTESNTMLIKGAIAGRRGSLVEIISN